MLDRPVRSLRFAAVAACAFLAWACGEPEGDPLERREIAVTEGAAAGYVADPVCGSCHSEIYRSYQEVGMARSFYRPRADRLVEDFGGEPFFHEPSKRYYRMHRDGDELTFERYQLDAEGRPIHRFEVKIDWILGSGHTSRTYIFRNPEGELYQLPIAWYSQTESWGMAPGFDNEDHFGVERRVRKECMFCHNAYPEVPEGSDVFGMPEWFPAELPEGLGCQRCHGPGAEHVRAALLRDDEATLSTVVNPAKLPAERAMDICYGCHFQPTVALSGVRRYGRATYSFLPGEPLTEYMVLLDVDQEDRTRDERFEINHHPYRLEQSTCFVESQPGELTCMRCHDPHRKVPAEERAEHYREACQSCHEIDACSLDAMRDAASLRDAGLDAVAVDDCAACHMPGRRTQDVIQVVMTDHRIQREPGGPELLAPLKEVTPVLVGAEMYREVLGMSPQLVQIYKASAVMRAGGSVEATNFLAGLLPGNSVPFPEPKVDLIRGLLGLSRFAEAEAVADEVLEVWPDRFRVREWRALARVSQGDPEGALADLEVSLAQAGDRHEPLFNQGRILYGLGRYDEATESLRRSVELRPNLPRSLLYLGRSLVELERWDEAEEAFRGVLGVDPSDHRAPVDLGRLLARSGRVAEAVEILEHAARGARFPDEIEQALAEVRGIAPGP